MMLPIPMVLSRDRLHVKLGVNRDCTKGRE